VGTWRVELLYCGGIMPTGALEACGARRWGDVSCFWGPWAVGEGINALFDMIGVALAMAF
jgi:hypothetical protein